MKNILLYIFIFVLQISTLVSGKNYGYIRTEENGKKIKYKINKAIYYENASVVMDTTVQVITGESAEKFYYPEIEKGDRTVLRILFGKENKLQELFIDYLPSEGDKTVLDDGSANIYYTNAFELREQKMEIGNIAGNIEIFKNYNKLIESVFLDLSFNEGEATYSFSGRINPDPAQKSINNIYSRIDSKKKSSINVRRMELAGVLISIFIIFFLTQ